MADLQSACLCALIISLTFQGYKTGTAYFELFDNDAITEASGFSTRPSCYGITSESLHRGNCKMTYSSGWHKLPP